MYLKTYLKALISGFNELFELFGKIQSIVGAFLFVSVVLFAANFTEFLDPFKAYYRPILIAGAFIALFLAGYKAWVKEHKINTEKQNKGTEITTFQAKNYVRSYTTKNKINTIGLSLTFIVSNHNNFPIKIKSLDLAELKRQFSFKSNQKNYSPAPFPISIEPNDVRELTFELEQDLKELSLHEQLQYIKDISHKKYSTKATILSVNGAEEIEIEIDFQNDEFIDNMIKNPYDFNQSIVNAILATP
ncbi:hypothetical protein B1H58_16565 [Pantoea alhagi]|uniref:Uncharacterized protein n=1 Tax=Pantoea alhagi TaxID=1891675 RepID=A0A1W6B8U4_9GAMM|nr:hypothetical protein [Pantoea alhagi]ARJ43491.1 hypothetical protein B1H58_16565 [Pantoea alhagi]